MNTVFLSGSRKISRLNDMVRGRLQSIVARGFPVVVGDANGADKAMQSHLFEQGYTNVVVFCVGDRCRNNVGSWPVNSVAPDPNLRGRALYTQRDKAMAAAADFGFVLWDGESEGSFNNILELLKKGKRMAVYLAPRKRFVNITTRDDARALLRFCEAEDSRAPRNLMRFRRWMESQLIDDQTVLNFPD